MGKLHVEYDINTVCYPIIESRKHCMPLTRTYNFTITNIYHILCITHIINYIIQNIQRICNFRTYNFSQKY